MRLSIKYGTHRINNLCTVPQKESNILPVFAYIISRKDLKYIFTSVKHEQKAVKNSPIINKKVNSLFWK